MPPKFEKPLGEHEPVMCEGPNVVEVAPGVFTTCGLRLLMDFVSPAEAKHLIEFVDAQPWNTQLSRRTQQYGYEYDYSGSKLPPRAAKPIPGPLKRMCDRLVEAGIFKTPPTQIIVNEYMPGQGIAPHIDSTTHFGPIIASLSLLDEYPLETVHFPEGPDATPKRSGIMLAVNSLLILEGNARYNMTHAIAQRKVDILGNGRRKKRRRRVSITFRTMKHESLQPKQTQATSEAPPTDAVARP